jgi:putative tryptophan/tyrosine transport system substrate-binding protein
MPLDQLKRRELITLLSGAAVTWPFAAHAQQPPGAMRRLGYISLGLQNDALFKATSTAFLQGLAALGWKEGFNLRIDWRWHGVDTVLAERQAAEVIALKPDVLFAVPAHKNIIFG